MDFKDSKDVEQISFWRLKKRVIYLHQYFITPDNGGGTRSYEFAKRMVQDGYDVHVITANSGSTKVKGWKSYEVDGIQVHSVSVTYSNSMTFKERITAFFKFAFKAGKKARSLNGDLVFATSTPLTIILPAIYAKLLRKIPIVFEVRDLWPEVPIAMGFLNNPIPRALARSLERLAYAYSSHIVALSPAMVEGVTKAVKDKKKVTLIPNSADIELFQNVDVERLQKWKSDRPWLGAKKLVLYAGTLGDVNGVEYLVRIAEKMSAKTADVNFLIIGEGKNKEKIYNLASQLGVLGNNLFIEGRIPKVDMPLAMSASTITCSLVIPIKELESNSANKVFDSFAAGKPVFINHGGWLAELLIKSNSGIVLSPDNLDLATEDLFGFLSDPERIVTASENSRLLGEHRFNRDLLYQKLDNIFKEVLRK